MKLTMNDNNKAKELAQIKFCHDHHKPMFVPHNGICYSCHKNVYAGLTYDKAAYDIITGCPWCSTSFCD